MKNKKNITMNAEKDYTLLRIEEPNTEIWIASNICINCIVKYNWFQKLMAKFLLGWKIKQLKTKD